MAPYYYCEQTMEDVFETMDIIDEDFQENDKTDHSYYIGSVLYIPDNNHYLMMNSISPELFFRYKSDIISEYLYEMSLMQLLRRPVIDVVQLIIQNNCYTCILKTFWIRIIQRTWKRVFAEKMRVLMKRGHPHSQRHFEIYGKYPETITRLPGLNGMMNHYLSNDKR